MPFSATVLVTDAKGERRERRPWKRVRPTSVALYETLQDSGTTAEGRRRALNAVAALKNARGEWSTACEVRAFLLERGDIPDNNPNRVFPRLNEMADGWDRWVTKDIDGQRTRVKEHVHCDVLVRGPKRKSRVSGITVITWQVKGRQ